MKITIFGGSGKVGRLVVQRLLDDGHEVTAFVHHTSLPFTSSALRSIYGDIHIANDIEVALRDADAVICTLGSWGTKSKDILSSAMRTIIPTMESLGMRRIVSLTGAAAALPADQLRLVDRLNRRLLSIVAPAILDDGETHLRLLAVSRLDWTVIRAPVMNTIGSQSYVLQGHPISPLSTVTRQATASAIVECIYKERFIRSAPFIRR